MPTAGLALPSDGSVDFSGDGLAGDAAAIGLALPERRRCPPCRPWGGAAARPRVGAVARPRVGAVARPRVGAVARPRVGAVARPRVGDDGDESHLGATPETEHGVDFTDLPGRHRPGGVTGGVRHRRGLRPRRLPARQAEEQRPAAGSRIAIPGTDQAIVDP
jgi:hypothetical protein